MSGVNSFQVGGDHYAKGGENQHWDWVYRALNGDYHLGCATKYVVRWREKNGLQDLRKASHYLAKAASHAETYSPNGYADTLLVLTAQFCDANGVARESLEAAFLGLVVLHDFEAADRILQQLWEQAKTEGYTDAEGATVGEHGKPAHPDYVWEGFSQGFDYWQCKKCRWHTKAKNLLSKPGTPTACEQCAAAEPTRNYVNQGEEK